MKTVLVFVGLFLLAPAVAQQQYETQPSGIIYGRVIGRDGKPAKGITLVASPLGVALGTRLPRTRSNDAGEYRFESLPWWGRYGVDAEDDDAGYSVFSSGAGRNDPPEVKLTPQQREARLNVYLPPKAGFVHIHLTDRRTGNVISGMSISLMSMEEPETLLFEMSCPSNHVVLVPPDKDIRLHVTSAGFHEWEESVGRGKPLRLTSGTQLTLDVQLDPIE